jgi:hypothetical protein
LHQSRRALVGTDYVEVFKTTVRDCLVQWDVPIGREQPAQIVAGRQAQAVGDVALGIQVDQEHPAS